MLILCCLTKADSRLLLFVTLLTFLLWDCVWHCTYCPCCFNVLILSPSANEKNCLKQCPHDSEGRPTQISFNPLQQQIMLILSNATLCSSVMWAALLFHQFVRHCTKFNSLIYVCFEYMWPVISRFCAVYLSRSTVALYNSIMVYKISNTLKYVTCDVRPWVKQSCTAGHQCHDIRVSIIRSAQTMLNDRTASSCADVCKGVLSSPHQSQTCAYSFSHSQQESLEGCVEVAFFQCLRSQCCHVITTLETCCSNISFHKEHKAKLTLPCLQSLFTACTICFRSIQVKHTFQIDLLRKHS